MGESDDCSSVVPAAGQLEAASWRRSCCTAFAVTLKLFASAPFFVILFQTIYEVVAVRTTKVLVLLGGGKYSMGACASVLKGSTTRGAVTFLFTGKG